MTQETNLRDLVGDDLFHFKGYRRDRLVQDDWASHPVEFHAYRCAYQQRLSTGDFTHVEVWCTPQNKHWVVHA